MGLRQNIQLRKTLSLATLLAGDFDFSPHDRITGQAGVITLRLTTPAASAGTQVGNVSVGTQQQVTDYIVGGEEYAGAGPNARIMPIQIAGLRGDFIRVNIRNPTGGTVVTTALLDVQNQGR
jgi:hypothetical protein